MIPQETIGVTVTFKEPVTFHLRMIGIAEENALRQKMFGLTEDEKAEKAYQNNVDMLADLSEEMPTVKREVTETIAVGVPGKHGEMEPKEVTSIKDVPLIENANSPAQAVRIYFKEKSIVKERIAEFAVRGYFVKLQPDVNFS